MGWGLVLLICCPEIILLIGWLVLKHLISPKMGVTIVKAIAQQVQITHGAVGVGRSE